MILTKSETGDRNKVFISADRIDTCTSYFYYISELSIYSFNSMLTSLSLRVERVNLFTITIIWTIFTWKVTTSLTSILTKKIEYKQKVSIVNLKDTIHTYYIANKSI